MKRRSMGQTSDQIIRAKRKRDRDTADIVYTPDSLVVDCMAVVSPLLKPTDVLLDPFAGTGAFFHRYPDQNPKLCRDIQGAGPGITVMDFFDTPEPSADWIVSNPPYSVFQRVLEKSCRVCRRGFAYVLALKKLTTQRLFYATQNGFNVTHLCIFRVRGGNWQNFTQCFVVWQRGLPPIWCTAPVDVKGTVSRIPTDDRRSLRLFTGGRDIIRKCLIAIPLNPGQTVAEPYINGAENSVSSVITGSSTIMSWPGHLTDWLFINTTLLSHLEFAEAVDRSARLATAGVAIILNTDRLTDGLLSRFQKHGLRATKIFPFEIRDMGGHIWYFLLLQRDTTIPSVFAFPPKTYEIH